MKHNAIRHYSMPLLVLGASLIASAVHAGLGEHRYGCQVITAHDQQGYISVRANSLEEGKAMANRTTDVPTRAQTRDAVKEVVQCVELPNGRFTDSDFQKWVDEVLER
ncbi:MAG: hypothetical protein R3E64_15855 [Halioglobus sp.]